MGLEPRKLELPYRGRPRGTLPVRDFQPGYLREIGDLDGVSLLHLFLSCRAAVEPRRARRPADRQAIERVAADMSVPFIGLWLEAPEPTLAARTEQRRNDPSDADADVIRMQHRQGTGLMTWHRVEASGSPEIVLEYARQYVQRHMPGILDARIADAPAPRSSRGEHLEPWRFSGIERCSSHAPPRA